MIRIWINFTFFALLLLSNTSVAFTTLDSKQVHLGNYIGKGKWTVIEVWESNCAACRSHMPEMVKFDGTLDNVQLIGVSLDTQEGIEKAEAFIEEYSIKFPTIISNLVEMNIWMQKAVGQGLLGTPTFLIFNPEGQIAAAQPGIVKVKAIESYVSSKTESSEEESDCADDL